MEVSSYDSEDLQHPQFQVGSNRPKVLCHIETHQHSIWNTTKGTANGIMLKAFNNILVVVKQTPYEQYLQLKAQGRAPVALRWERLKNRYTVHKTCVDDVTSIIDSIGIKYSLIGREELHRGSIQDRDLVIAVGGDGTVLNTASFIDDSIPVLGVNSDPSRIEEIRGNEKRDERRSRGALCAISACNVHATLPQILYGDVAPGLRSRIQCLVRSTYTETRLPPSLNDILITQPVPAAVSRFRLSLCKGKAKPSFKTTDEDDEVRIGFCGRRIDLAGY